MAYRVVVMVTRCEWCKATIRAPEWRRRRFCSISCSNRRERRKARRYEERDRRIVDLSAKGLRAPTIAAMLIAENPEWQTSPGTVRMILSRTKRHHATGSIE